MLKLSSRDIEYQHDGTVMKGLLCSPAGAQALPSVVLIHDAFGLSERMIGVAKEIAALGYAVFAADVWGDRLTPQPGDDIGALIGSMVGDRPRWQARVAAAHDVAAQQPEVDGAELVSLGYCFGGSSALEYLRLGGDLKGVISIHGGLDLLESDWSNAQAGVQVLVSTGAADPMATPEQLADLQTNLTEAGMDWEVNLYADTKHAFTSPDADSSGMPDHVVGYYPRNAERAWQATTRVLAEAFVGQRVS